MSYYNGQKVNSTIIAGGAVDTVPSGGSANPLANKSISQNFSNVLKGIKSGITVSVDDASPLEHELSVKVESKNLFTNKNYSLKNGATNITLVQNNSFSFESGVNSTGQTYTSFPLYLKKGTYYISGDDIVTSNSSFLGGYGVYASNDVQIIYESNVTSIGAKFDVTEDGTYYFYFYGSWAADLGTVYTFSNIQLEKASAKTDFTPFVYAEDISVSKLVDGVEVQSETPLSDGTVEGFTSSPAFELISSEDDGSVLINLEYNKDINKISFGGGTGTGEDGYSPIAKVSQTASGAVITITDKDGTTTATIKDGKDGDPYTLTEADKAEIVALAVIQIKDGGVVGVVGEDNNILLSGSIANGTYTLKYENEDGTYTEIGTLDVGSVLPPYTNLADPTVTTDTTVTTASQGWLEGVRINSSGNITTQTGFDISNIVPIGSAETVRIKGMTLDGVSYGRIYFYSGTTYLFYLNPAAASERFTALTTEYAEITVSELLTYLQNNSEYDTFDSLRFGGQLNTTKEDVIITLDEEIV